MTHEQENQFLLKTVKLQNIHSVKCKDTKSIHKIVFLHTLATASKEIIREQLPFKTALKKYLGINLTGEVKYKIINQQINW